MMLSTLPFIAATVVAIVVKLLTAVHVDRFLAASVTHGFYQALYTLGKSGSLRQALVVSFAASDTPAWEPSVAGFIHLRPVGPLRVGLLDRFRHAGVRLRGRIRKKITLWDHSLICSDPTAIGIILDVVRRVQEPGMGCRTGNSRVPELS
jgi:hypothetical protein